MEIITMDISYVLVGKFMSKWAIAEQWLDIAIATSLKVDAAESVVLSSAIPVANKLELAKSMIFLSKMSKEDSKIFTKQIDDFRGLLESRNTVAHCMFSPNGEGNAVQFFRMATRGTLRNSQKKWKESTWSDTKFVDLFDKLDGLVIKFKELNKKFKESELSPPVSLAQALSGTKVNPFTGILGPPTPGLFGAGIADAPPQAKAQIRRKSED